MSDLQRAVEAFRRDLLARDQRVAEQMRLAYLDVQKRIRERINRLEATEVADLFTQRRLEALLEQVELEMRRFGAVASQTLTAEQRRVIAEAESASRQMTFAALADAEAELPSLSIVWNRLPTEAIENLVGALGDGSPVAALFEEIGATAKEGIRRALITGLATGQNPRIVGRQIQQVFDIGLTRARTIARTEIFRAQREASRQSYLANADVVIGWRWVAALSGRTCVSCIAMHGKVFPLSEPFGSHPNCRCAVAPVVSGATEIPSGDAWLRGQTLDVQEEVLGVQGAALWRRNEVALDDFVRESYDARWGTTRRVANLSEARSAAERRQPSKAA